jgi:hypothetical protein
LIKSDSWLLPKVVSGNFAEDLLKNRLQMRLASATEKASEQPTTPPAYQAGVLVVPRLIVGSNQANATKDSSLSITSANPATILRPFAIPHIMKRSTDAESR